MSRDPIFDNKLHSERCCMAAEDGMGSLSIPIHDIKGRVPERGGDGWGCENGRRTEAPNYCIQHRDPKNSGCEQTTCEGVSCKWMS
jgi:hypothetical protein